MREDAGELLRRVAVAAAWCRPRGQVVLGHRADRPVALGVDRAVLAGARYSGDVRVVRDGSAVTIEMGLRQVNGSPRVGDRFEVVQNPDVPTDVAFLDRSLVETLAGACLGGLGVFVLALAFFWF